jgi:hypothetical protein
MRWNLARGSRWTRPIVGIRVQGNPIARRPHFLKDLNDGSDLAQVTLWACVGPASGSSPASLPSAHPAACGPSRDLVSKGPGSGQPYSAAASQAAAAWVNPVKPQTLRWPRLLPLRLRPVQRVSTEPGCSTAPRRVPCRSPADGTSESEAPAAGPAPPPPPPPPPPPAPAARPEGQYRARMQHCPSPQQVTC